MLLGYMRVSRADGSQVLDLQKDALLAAGVEAGHLYKDLASGKRDDRPGLAAGLKALRRGDVLVAWKLDRLGRDLRHLVNLVHELTETGVGELCSELGVTRQTLYRHVGPAGELREDGRKLLQRSRR